MQRQKTLKVLLAMAFFITVIHTQVAPCMIIEQSALGTCGACSSYFSVNQGNFFMWSGDVTLSATYNFKGNQSYSISYLNFETITPINPLGLVCSLVTSPAGIYYRGDKITIGCSCMFDDRVLIPQKTGVIFKLFTDTTSILEVGIKTPAPTAGPNLLTEKSNDSFY